MSEQYMTAKYKPGDIVAYRNVKELKYHITEIIEEGEELVYKMFAVDGEPNEAAFRAVQTFIDQHYDLVESGSGVEKEPKFKQGDVIRKLNVIFNDQDYLITKVSKIDNSYALEAVYPDAMKQMQMPISYLGKITDIDDRYILVRSDEEGQTPNRVENEEKFSGQIENSIDISILGSTRSFDIASRKIIGIEPTDDEIRHLFYEWDTNSHVLKRNVLMKLFPEQWNAWVDKKALPATKPTEDGSYKVGDIIVEVDNGQLWKFEGDFPLYSPFLKMSKLDNPKYIKSVHPDVLYNESIYISAAIDVKPPQPTTQDVKEETPKPTQKSQTGSEKDSSLEIIIKAADLIAAFDEWVHEHSKTCDVKETFDEFRARMYYDNTPVNDLYNELVKLYYDVDDMVQEELNRIDKEQLEVVETTISQHRQAKLAPGTVEYVSVPKNLLHKFDTLLRSAEGKRKVRVDKSEISRLRTDLNDIILSSNIQNAARENRKVAQALREQESQ